MWIFTNTNTNRGDVLHIIAQLKNIFNKIIQISQIIIKKNHTKWVLKKNSVTMDRLFFEFFSLNSSNIDALDCREYGT